MLGGTSNAGEGLVGGCRTAGRGNSSQRPGRIIEEINPAPQREINIDPQYRQVILDGLHAAATQPGGTSYPVFGHYPIDVAGKTGTAETSSGYDQSWYAGIAPYDNPRDVVVATVERGGFGADAAAPVVSKIFPAIPELGSNNGGGQ